MSFTATDRRSHLVSGRMSIKLAWEAIGTYTMTGQIAVCIERDVRGRIVAFRVPIPAFSLQQQDPGI